MPNINNLDRVWYHPPANPIYYPLSSFYPLTRARRHADPFPQPPALPFRSLAFSQRRRRRRRIAIVRRADGGLLSMEWLAAPQFKWPSSLHSLRRESIPPSISCSFTPYVIWSLICIYTNSLLWHFVPFRVLVIWNCLWFGCLLICLNDMKCRRDGCWFNILIFSPHSLFDLLVFPCNMESESWYFGYLMVNESEIALSSKFSMELV